MLISRDQVLLQKYEGRVFLVFSFSLHILFFYSIIPSNVSFYIDYSFFSSDGVLK